MRSGIGRLVGRKAGERPEYHGLIGVRSEKEGRSLGAGHRERPSPHASIILDQFWTIPSLLQAQVPAPASCPEPVEGRKSLDLHA